jgi:hypothetical protein
MTGLKTGTTVADVPGLRGRWSVWSQAADGPATFFLIPLDDEARATGIKYAVVRALRMASELSGPVIELVRTDPTRPDLVEASQRIAKERRQQRSTAR